MIITRLIYLRDSNGNNLKAFTEFLDVEIEMGISAFDVLKNTRGIGEVIKGLKFVEKKL